MKSVKETEWLEILKFSNYMKENYKIFTNLEAYLELAVHANTYIHAYIPSYIHTCICRNAGIVSKLANANHKVADRSAVIT